MNAYVCHCFVDGRTYYFFTARATKRQARAAAKREFPDAKAISVLVRSC